ncbi:hypothetical protein, partial [Mesorhizobium sp.]|uniref:hypothetical protein n=1 Tax=Mesorhizobium sp. TaxID=1871066 RepID=UPI0025D5C2DA
SALPGISPTRGEIGSVGDGANCSTLEIGERRSAAGNGRISQGMRFFKRNIRPVKTPSPRSYRASPKIASQSR